MPHPRKQRFIFLQALSFTVSGGRIVGLDMASDPAKLRHLAIQR
jgi:hypothetical protein